MDEGYNNSRVYAECAERGVEPVTPLRGVKGKQSALPIGVGGRLFQHFRDLYRGRDAVEREFSYLKTHHGLAQLRVRGIERVRIHADLTILARLAQALARARAIPLAA